MSEEHTTKGPLPERPMDRLALALERSVHTARSERGENRKTILMVSGAFVVILLLLTLAVWLSVFSLGNLGKPGITIDQAVAAGHAVVVEYDDGAKGIKWMPGPAVYTQEIERQTERADQAEFDLGAHQTALAESEESLRKITREKVTIEAGMAEIQAALSQEHHDATEALAELNALRRAIGDTSLKLRYKDLPKGARNISLMETLEADAGKPEEAPGESADDEGGSKWNPKNWFGKKKK